MKPLLPEDAEAKTGQARSDEQAEEIEKGLSGINWVLLSFAGGSPSSSASS